jgi:hypothetical protein
MAALSTADWWAALHLAVANPVSGITVDNWPAVTSARTTTNVNLTCHRGGHPVSRLATELAKNLDKNKGVFRCHECDQRLGTIPTARTANSQYISPALAVHPGAWIEPEPGSVYP